MCIPFSCFPPSGIGAERTVCIMDGDGDWGIYKKKVCEQASANVPRRDTSLPTLREGSI
jgi:hypothetical protein